MRKNILFILKIVVVCSVIMSFSACGLHYFDGQKNKRIMIKYIEENYGTDYEIIDKYLGNYGSGGRQKDVLEISQNGINYRVESKDGKVVWDEYNNKMTGKFLSDYLLSIVGEPDVDFSIYCTVYGGGGVGPYCLPTPVTSIDDIQKYNTQINLSLFNIPKDKFREKIWMYDFYETVISLEMNELSLYISTFELGEAEVDLFSTGARPRISFHSGYTSKNNKKVLTIEEFFDKFEYKAV